MEKIRRSILMGVGKTLLLGFALLVIALAATSCEQPDNNVADYITTADGTWEIYSAQGLLDWNAYVMKNTGSEDTPEYPNLGTSAKLMADISLEGISWTPVGYYDYGTDIEYYYAGTFDGGGHTISNLKINLPTTNDLGLFVGVAETGVVKDLTLSDVEISGAYYIGGIAGKNYGTIENCSVSGSVSGTYGVGGIVGTNVGIVSDCTNIGNILGSENTGSIVGTNGIKGTITFCCNKGEVSGTDYVGGIAGQNGGTITACYNIGNISGYLNIGGIIGENDGTIAACYNTGNVSGSQKIGGIAGRNDKIISACYNIGEVSGTDYVGGIIGENGDSSTNGIIISCYNTGKASGTNADSVVGGIAGYSYGTITACYWSVPEGSSITPGIGEDYGTETTATKVDGTWNDAWSGMNEALSEAESEYSYKENDDSTTKETMPLVIVKLSN